MSYPKPNPYNAARIYFSRQHLLPEGSLSAQANPGCGLPLAIPGDNAVTSEDSPRLPSSRPIDHRWDRSRGIIFRTLQGPTTRPSTWTPQDDIKFAPKSHSRRAYAMRSLDSGRPAPKPLSRHDNPKSKLDDVKPMPSGPKTDQLHGVIRNLERDVADKTKLAKELKSKNERLEQILERLKEAHNTELTKEAAKRTADLEKERLTILRLVDERTATVQAKVNKAQEEHRQFKAEVKRLQEEIKSLNHLPVQSERLKVIANDKIRKAEKLGEALNKAHKETLIIDRQTLARDFTAKRAALEREFNDKEQAMQRRRAERASYNAYKGLFVALTNTLGTLGIPIKENILQRNDAAEYVKHHIRIGADFKKTFKGSMKNSHAALLDRIGEYLKSKQLALETARSIYSTRRLLEKALAGLNYTGHRSRTLTNVLRFDRVTESSIALQWYRELNIRPFQDTSHEIKKMMLEAPLDDQRALAIQRAKLNQIITVHTSLSTCLNLQVLSNGPAPEKFAYALSLKAEKGLETANYIMKDVRLALANIPMEEINALYNEYRVYRNEYDLLLQRFRSFVNMRVNLGQSLGRVSPQEIEDVENILKSDQDFYKETVIEAVAVLTRTKRSFQPNESALEIRVPVSAQTKARSTTEKLRIRDPKMDQARKERKARRSEATRRGLNPSDTIMEAGQQTSQIQESENTASVPGPGKVIFSPTMAMRAQHVLWPSISDSSEAPAIFGECVNDKGDVTEAYSEASILAAHDVTDTTYRHMHSDVISSAAGAKIPPLAQTEDSEQSMATSTGIAEDLKNSAASAFALNDGLRYQIPEAELRNASLAVTGSDASFWSHTLYRNAEGEKPTLYYCIGFETAEKRAQEFLGEPVIGFDIEWEIGAKLSSGNAKRNVSLIQIATEDKIALFHISLFKGDSAEELMPPSLKRILESKEVVKTGVNIQGDSKRLNACLDVKMKGLLEISHLYKVVLLSEAEPEKVNRVMVNLAKQVQDILGLPLKKGEVRTSAWSKKLDFAQTEYAGADAYAGYRLFKALEARRLLMNPLPPRPAFYEEFAPLVLGDGTSIPYAPYIKPSYTGRKPAKGKAAEAAVGDEMNEEFYDALENLDLADSPATTVAGVPLAGFVVSYPELPELDDTTPPATTSSDQAETRTARSRAKSAKTQLPPSPELAEADAWVTRWRESRPVRHQYQVSNPSLRAWYLWHRQEMSVAEIAACLRQPPLASSTVASYIMGAVKGERLPYETSRVGDVVKLLSPSIAGRYKNLGATN